MTSSEGGALGAIGYRVFRLWNNNVIENRDGVLQMLLSVLEKNSPSPRPSPRKRGEGDDRWCPFLAEHAIVGGQVNSELV